MSTSTDKTLVYTIMCEHRYRMSCHGTLDECNKELERLVSKNKCSSKRFFVEPEIAKKLKVKRSK